VTVWNAGLGGHFLMKLKFSQRVLEELSNVAFKKKIRPVGAELFHAGGWMDRRTYTTKQMVASRNFAKAPKNSSYQCCRTPCQNFILRLHEKGTTKMLKLRLRQALTRKTFVR
jgi:hypothetical protein